jgi:excinuclease UvrABC nuclease subunit
MTAEPLWQRMDARWRRSMAALRSSDIPESPGVYALYRDGSRMYVGKADCLRDRVWKRHSGAARS